MPDYRGLCAACGVSKFHKNFKGRRSGYVIPDPCYVALRKRRKAKDDRLCCRCYEVHLANIPKEPITPTTVKATNRRSSTSTVSDLDGVGWKEPKSERAAKLSYVDSNGTPVIPLKLHVEKMGELKDAMRNEQLEWIAHRKHLADEQMELDNVQSIFLRNDLSEVDRANVLRRVLQYYKEKPSAERARLLQDLSNVQAQDLVGVSSHTMAKARKLEFGVDPEPPSKKQRVGMSRGGYFTDEITRIAFEACCDPRFCEVRAWKSHSGDLSETHCEAIGLVDVKTMWEALCRKHVDFCSLRNFYRLMPDIFVPKKKERCVCAHCKRGRRRLDDSVMLINALRNSLDKDDDLQNDLVQLRFDLMILFGHLDKEVVIDIADGRHRCDTQRCTKCALLESIPERAAHIAALIISEECNLKISRDHWASVFPGVEIAPTYDGRRNAVVHFFSTWKDEIGTYVSHLFLKADRIRELESDVEKLSIDQSTEVIYSDYAMSIKLIGTFDETEADFLSKDTANNLGFMRVYYANGQMWREYWDFVFEGPKDIQATIQIQKLFLEQIRLDRKNRGLLPLTRVKFWVDNASDFKGGDAWDQWQKELKFAENDVDNENRLECVVFNYHAEGEGKTKLDGHFGHLKTLRMKRERLKLERSTVGDLLLAMQDAEATHVVHVELDRENEGRFYKTAKGISRFHQIEVTKDTLKAKESSMGKVELLDLKDVKDRKTKRALAQKAKQQPRVHIADVKECQSCHNQMKKGESVDEWIQCEECDRSWHKTCVGHPADTDIASIAWSKCGSCGGADPEGESLQKRRKVACCVVCGMRRKGNDHSECLKKRADEAAAFRTPPAVALSIHHHAIGRKVAKSAKKNRQGRKIRKRRKKSGRIVSQDQLHQLAKHL